MATKKDPHTNPSKVVHEQMVALIEWASEPPRHRKRWHDIGTLEASKQAARLLERSGAIEVNWVRNQYRLTPKP